MGATTGEVVDELKGTLGEKLLRADPDSRVVVNFHGVSRVVCTVSTSTFKTIAQSRYIRTNLTS